MKKVYYMLLMICTICAFSACSDDDKETPQSPITNPVVPQTAAVGEEITISGIGFTTNSKLFLKGSDAQMTALPVKSASETGIVVTVPGTLAAGTYKVIIQQGGDWELGTIAITSENPITEYSVPKKSLLGGAMVIKGIGFADDCKVSLKPVLGDPVDVGTVKKVDGGIEVTVPANIEEGTYTVVLTQNGNWELGTTKVMTEIRVVIEKKVVDKYFEDGMLEEIPAESITTTLKYDGQGRVTTIQKKGDNIDENWDITYINNEVVIIVSGMNSDEPIENKITFTLDNGKATHCIDTLNKNEYTWHYDKLEYLLSVTNDNDLDDIVAEFDYNNSDINSWSNMDFSADFSYETSGATLNNQSGVDLFACIIEAINYNDLTVTARLLGINGKYPVHLPKQMDSADWGIYNISYTKSDEEIATIELVYREEDGDAYAENVTTFTIK